MIPIGLALVSAFGFGSAAIFARIGMQGIRPLPSTFISGIASLLPTAVPGPALRLSRPESPAAPGFPLLSGHGALTYLGGRVQNYIAINLIGAARSGPFVGSAALFAAIFAIIFLGESLHPVVALGTVGVVLGLITSGGDRLFAQSWRLDRWSLLGYLTSLVAAASYGGSNLVAKALSQEYGSPLVVAAFAMFFGSLFWLPSPFETPLLASGTPGKAWALWPCPGWLLP